MLIITWSKEYEEWEVHGKHIIKVNCCWGYLSGWFWVKLFSIFLK